MEPLTPVPAYERPDEARLQRARDYAVGPNAHLGRTPERLEALAAHLPLTRRERAAMRHLAKKAGTSCPITGPRRVRDRDPYAVPAAVDHWLAQHPAGPGDGPAHLAAQMASTAGHSQASASRAARRLQRFMLSHPGRRMPGHMRDKAVLTSAVVMAVSRRYPGTLAIDRGA